MRVFLIAFVIFFNALRILARSISLPAGLLVHKWFTGHFLQAGFGIS
jgi:hypothetical protein